MDPPSTALNPGILRFLKLVEQTRIEAKVKTYSQLVTRACRDQYALQEARNIVPIARLVQDNLEILEGDYQENLLHVLVDWFKTEFFKWFSPPECEGCNKKLESHGNSVNIEGRLVENYKCNNSGCTFTYDFIRHNDPAILLTTKQGRCGEWANCFMLILRALDYDTRLVVDTTDHVWNEVWSEVQERWVHVDPCEGAVDTPLLYEAGWSKKLEYCLAFSQFEVLDVTRRYSVDFNTTKGRRKSCDEVWFEQYLDDITSKLLEGLPVDVRDNILKRRAKDKDYMRKLTAHPRSVENISNLQGRKTGDMSWRIQRGEYSPIIKNSSVIKVVRSLKEIDENDPLFTLEYNTDKNNYSSSSENYHKKGWSSLTYLCENLDYKYEIDWRTSYVARYETCPYNHEGKIQWRFDLSSLDKTWKRLEIQVNCKVYPNTSVDLNLISCDENRENPKEEHKLDINVRNILTPNRFKYEVIILDLMAKLSGGHSQDNVAWQKPQLFRQTRGENADEWAFTFKVY